MLRKTTLVAAALAATLCSSAFTSAVAAGDTSAPVKRSAGVATKATGKANGGWLGTQSVKVGNTVYSAQFNQPNKAPSSAITMNASNQISWQNDLGGAYSGPTAKDTASMAYILDQWGKTRESTKAAAVDLAVSGLAHGKAHKYNGKVGKKRLAQVKGKAKRKAIVKQTKAMLRSAKANSGPYASSLTAHGNQNTMNVAYQLRTISGKGVAGKRVVLKIGNSSFTATTDSSGYVRTSLLNSAAGSVAVTATAEDLVNWRVGTLKGSGNGSGLFVGSTRTAHVTKVTGTIVGDQRATFTLPASYTVPAPMKGTVRVDGYGGKRNVTTALYGPFATKAAADAAPCNTTPVVTRVQEIDGNTTVALPEYSAGVGFWRYGVSAAGNSTNNPLWLCDTPRVAKHTVGVSIARNETSVTAGRSAKAKVTVSGLTNTEERAVVVRLYGPYTTKAAVKCDASKQVGTTTLRIKANGTYTTGGNATKGKGWYGWRAEVNTGTFNLPANTPCPQGDAAKFEAK